MADLNTPARKKKYVVYPAPFIISPTSTHTQSIIFLHGRGSNGEKFGVELLASKTASGKTLQEHFPHMKFIFPTAKKRRAKAYNRAVINQWFDNVPIDEQKRGMSRAEIEWQLDGLTETAEFLSPVLDEEVKTVGAKNVFLAGLSQGCAMGLHLLLSYQVKESEGGEQGGSLAGFIGMSGWLPFAEDIRQLIGIGGDSGQVEEEDDNDPFATSGDEGEDIEFDSEPQLSPAIQICNLVRQNMEMSPLISEPACLKTPVLFGHGKSDKKVAIELGREAAMILKEIDMQVTWEEYDEGHWYKVPEQIDSMVEFLKKCLEAGT